MTLDLNRWMKLVLVAMTGVLVVVLITLVSSDPPRDDLGASAVTDLSDLQRPPSMTEDAEPADRPGLDALGTSESTVIQRADPETGELQQEFFYGSLTPREQGIVDIDEPRARLYLEPWRVIHMRSDEGRFVAPDNHPESGEFRENVVITIFQSPEDRAVDLSPRSDDRIVKVKLDEASFDTTLGEIRSDSDIELFTPSTQQVHFRGRGLKMVYNDLGGRVEYLEIPHGESMRYNPDAAERSAGATPEVAPEATAEAGEEPSASEGIREEGAPPEPEGRDVQYYQVTFEDAVHVRGEGRSIEADRLVVYFPMDRSGEEGDGEAVAGGSMGRPAGSASAGSAKRIPLGALGTSAESHATINALSMMLGQVGGSAGSLSTGPEKDPDAMPHGADDVTLTWSGKMVMTPVDNPPDRLSGGRDMYLRFEGSPVTVSTGEDDRLLCRRLEYLDSQRLVTASGSEGDPVRVQSPELGDMTGERLIVRLDDNTARLDGTGAIRAAAPPTLAAGQQPEAPRGLPPGFRVSWTDGVDLAFSDAADADSDRESMRLDSATFRGDVRIADEQFELFADTVAPRFASPDGSGDPQLETLDAVGNVHVETEDGSIRARKLRVETAPSEDGRFVPARMIAEGDVRMIDPTRRMSAGFLRVNLVERAEAPEGREDSEAAGADSIERRMGVDVETITAMEDVRMTMPDGTTATGYRLDADAQKRTAVLVGSPVVLTREEGEGADAGPRSEIHVLELKVEENDGGQVAWCDGAGEFTYTEPDDPETGQPGRRVTVTWTDRMRFDDAIRTIQVFGDVVTEVEDSPTQMNRVTAEQMTLELLDPDAEPERERIAETAQTDEAEEENPAVNEGLGTGQLKRLVAREDVVLLATTWREAARRDVATRFRLTGPVLSFYNLDQVARVDGPGTMLTEDYRSDGDAETPETGEAGGSGGMNAAVFSGRGATAFTWSQRLTLDQGSKSMTLEGQVRMTHEPVSNGRILELQSDRLVARLESDQPLDAMDMADADLNLDRIEATGAVQVRDPDRLISTDRLLYDGADRSVLLTGSPSRPVTVARLDQPKPLRARTIRWDLETGGFEVIEAGF